MELIADSLDGEVEETRFADPLMTRVLKTIRAGTLTPDELATVKEEASWEQTKRDARLEGKLEEARRSVRKVLARRGIKLEAGDEARLDACKDLEALDRWQDQAFDATSAADALRQSGRRGERITPPSSPGPRCPGLRRPPRRLCADPPRR